MSIDDSSASSRRTRGRRNELPEELRPRQQRGQSPGNASAGGSSITSNGGRARSRSRSPGVMHTPVVRRPATHRDRPVPTVSIVPEESLSNVTVQPDLTQQTFTSTQTTQLMEQTTAHKRQKKQQSVDPSLAVATSSSAATAILMASLGQPVLSPPPARVVPAAAASSSNPSKPGRTTGSSNWTHAEVSLLTSIVRNVLPAGADQWNLVAQVYSAAAKAMGLSAKNPTQVKKKHQDLVNRPPPTGDPTMCEFTKQARITQDLITEAHSVVQTAGPMGSNPFFNIQPSPPPRDDLVDAIDLTTSSLPQPPANQYHDDSDQPVSVVNQPPAAAANIPPAPLAPSTPQINMAPLDRTTPAQKKRRIVDAGFEQIDRLAKRDNENSGNVQSTLLAMMAQNREESKRRDEQFRQDLQLREQQRRDDLREREQQRQEDIRERERQRRDDERQRREDERRRKEDAKRDKDEFRTFIAMMMGVRQARARTSAVALLPEPEPEPETDPEDTQQVTDAQQPIEQTSIASSMPPLTQH